VARGIRVEERLQEEEEKTCTGLKFSYFIGPSSL
jgi:hypothetical protein